MKHNRKAVKATAPAHLQLLSGPLAAQAGVPRGKAPPQLAVPLAPQPPTYSLQQTQAAAWWEVGRGPQGVRLHFVDRTSLPDTDCCQSASQQKRRGVSRHCSGLPGKCPLSCQQVLDHTGKQHTTLAGESIHRYADSGKAPGRLATAPPAHALRSDGGAPHARQ